MIKITKKLFWHKDGKYNAWDLNSILSIWGLTYYQNMVCGEDHCKVIIDNGRIVTLLGTFIIYNKDNHLIGSIYKNIEFDLPSDDGTYFVNCFIKKQFINIELNTLPKDFILAIINKGVVTDTRYIVQYPIPSYPLGAAPLPLLPPPKKELPPTIPDTQRRYWYNIPGEMWIEGSRVIEFGKAKDRKVEVFSFIVHIPQNVNYVQLFKTKSLPYFNMAINTPKPRDPKGGEPEDKHAEFMVQYLIYGSRTQNSWSGKPFTEWRKYDYHIIGEDSHMELSGNVLIDEEKKNYAYVPVAQYNYLKFTIAISSWWGNGGNVYITPGNIYQQMLQLKAVELDVEQLPRKPETPPPPPNEDQPPVPTDPPDAPDQPTPPKAPPSDEPTPQPGDPGKNPDRPHYPPGKRPPGVPDDLPPPERGDPKRPGGGRRRRPPGAPRYPRRPPNRRPRPKPRYPHWALVAQGAPCGTYNLRYDWNTVWDAPDEPGTGQALVKSWVIPIYAGQYYKVVPHNINAAYRCVYNATDRRNIVVTLELMLALGKVEGWFTGVLREWSRYRMFKSWKMPVPHTPWKRWYLGVHRQNIFCPYYDYDGFEMWCGWSTPDEDLGRKVYMEGILNCGGLSLYQWVCP